LERRPLMPDDLKPDQSQTQTQDPPENPLQSGFTRRGFLRGAGITAVVAVAEGRLADVATAQPAPQAAASALNKPISGEINTPLNINGRDRQITVEPRTTLLSAIRDRLEPALTGPKLVCNMGTCGACTVILDGKAVYGCSVLAVDVIGKKITTVEGIGT